MKKTAILLLFSIYACSQLGSVTWQYSKPFIRLFFSGRQRIRSLRNETDDLVSIKVDKATFQKIKKDRKEVRWKGVLHDIEQITFRDDNVHLLLRKDEEETWWLKIHDTISDWLQKKDPAQDQTALPMWKWLMKIYTPLTDYGFPAIVQLHSRAFPGASHRKLPLSPFLPGTGQPPDFRG
jgi:hypothetical protein